MKKLKIFLLVSAITFFLVLIVKAFENPPQDPPLGGGALQVQSNQLLITKPTKVTGTSTFIVEDGNVGIGTTSPVTKLHVNDIPSSPGSDTGKDGVRFTVAHGNYGGAQTTRAVYIGIPNLGTNLNSLHSYGLYIDDIYNYYGANTNIGGSKNYGLYIKGGADNYISGNVGIGTTSPNYKLDVVGDIRSSGKTYLGTAGFYAQYEYKTSANVGGAGWYRVATISGEAGRGQQQVTIYTTGGSYTPRSTTFRWYHDWSTGAGVTVISEIGSGYWTDVRVTDDGTNSFLEVYFTQAITGLHIGLQYIGGHDRGTIYSGTLPAGGGTLRAITKANGLFALSNKFTVDSSGRVGIGTMAPVQQLQVAGNAAITGNVGIGTTAPNRKLHLAGLGFSDGLLLEGGNDGGNIEWRTGTTRHWNIDQYGTNPDLRFFTEDPTDGTGVVRMLITEAGNVGIGTTNPGAKLDVNGSIITFGGNLFFSGNGECCGRSGDTYIGHPSDGTLTFFTDGAERMRIIKNGYVGIGTPNPTQKLDVRGNVIANNYFNHSDIRFKQNILPLNSSGSVLEKLNNLQGFYFDWNDVYKNSKIKDNERHIGLIAQEVEKEFPELVFGGNNGSDYLAVDYSRFTAVLLEGLKELNQKLEELKNKIENGILYVKEIFTHRVTTKEIQLIDKSTNEIYCVWLENGEVQKSKGECR